MRSDSPDEWEQLVRQLELEHKAHHEDHRSEAIRLSGQFHSLLAQIAGNSVMQRMKVELITRTSPIIGLFGGPDVSNCCDDEHETIVQAIRQRDSKAASRLMTQHLRNIQDNRDLDGRADTPLDMDLILRG